VKIDEKNVAEAKRILKQTSTRGKPGLTAKEFVASLINEIHAKMAEGFTVTQLWEQVNETLPEGSKIQKSTFGRYVQIAREEAGITPVKKWTRKEKVDDQGGDKKITEAKMKDNIKADQKDKTEGDFRNTGEDL
jgi:hypothetical protein